jgi:hypothetical protein
MQVADFMDKHQLEVLREYKELQNKNLIGEVYRHDQWYFENISNFKAKYFGIKSLFLKLKEENTDRSIFRKIDDSIAMVEEKIKMLETYVFTAKQRIKFYQDVIFIVSNRSYGDY